MASGRRTKGRPQLRYKGVCKRDMKALDSNTESREDLAADRMMWRRTLNQHLKSGEKKLVNAEVGKRSAERSATTPTEQRPHTNTTFEADVVFPTSVSTATSHATIIKQTGLFVGCLLNVPATC